MSKRKNKHPRAGVADRRRARIRDLADTILEMTEVWAEFEDPDEDTFDHMLEDPLFDAALAEVCRRLPATADDAWDFIDFATDEAMRIREVVDDKADEEPHQIALDLFFLPVFGSDEKIGRTLDGAWLDRTASLLTEHGFSAPGSRIMLSSRLVQVGDIHAAAPGALRRVARVAQKVLASESSTGRRELDEAVGRALGGESVAALLRSGSSSSLVVRAVVGARLRMDPVAPEPDPDFFEDFMVPDGADDDETLDREAEQIDRWTTAVQGPLPDVVVKLPCGRGVAVGSMLAQHVQLAEFLLKSAEGIAADAIADAAHIADDGEELLVWFRYGSVVLGPIPLPLPLFNMAPDEVESEIEGLALRVVRHDSADDVPVPVRTAH